MASDLLKAALKYQEMGFSVFPVNPKDKRPAISSWLKYQTEIASIEEITEWFGKLNHQGIAIVTGKVSNLFVVDLDKYKPDFKEEIALQYFPDSLVTPTVKTMGGGQHLYFLYPDIDITIRAGILPGIDYRGQGGYVVAPPTQNQLGHGYEWIISFDQSPLAVLPDAFLKALINTSYLYKGVTEKNEQVLQSVTINLNKGTRDDSLFHVANCLIKGGCNQADTELVLKLLANQCNPPFPKNEVETKIKSVLQRAERKERNLMKELDCYIAVTDGGFSVTDCYMALHVVTKEDKTAIRVGLNRRKDKTIEKYGPKDGVYKKIVHDIEFLNFDEDEPEEIEYPVKLPLGLNDMVEIYEGNIILVAGEFNSGKTLFELNVLQMNKNLLPIRYMSSEMNKNEFRKRFRGFTSLPPSFWKQDDMTDYIIRSMDFHTAIRPNAINIIDYMEFKGADFTLGAELMRQIHDGLGGKGVAVVAIQKKQGAALPRSGDLVMEKPRLVVALSKIQGQENKGYATILKAKAVKLGKCDGKKLIFEVEGWGSSFKVISDWGYYRV